MEEKKPASSAEIDLLYFLKPLNNGIKSVGKTIRYYFLLWKNNLVLFFSIVILITLMGFSMRYVIKPAYQTTGFFISNFLPAKYCEILISNINGLQKEQNFSALSKELNIPVDAAGTIKSIKLSHVPDTFAFDNRDTTISLFSIQMVLTNMDHLDTIQKGVINYLETTPYAMRRKNAKMKTLTAMRQSIIEKLKSLDSLKQIVNNSITPRSQGQGIILGEPVNPIPVYQAEMSYYRDQLRIEEQLFSIDNIEVLQPFFKTNYYNYPNFQKYLIYSFLLSIIIATLTVLLIGKRPKIE